MSDKPISAKKLYDLLTPEVPEIEAGTKNPMTEEELEAAQEEALEEARAKRPPFSQFQEALTILRARYSRPMYGFELAEVAGGYQFRTKPGRAALAKKLAKVSTQRLSSGAMESLAIVAYKQPILKEDIDKIRGVDSSYFIRQLLDKKLIYMAGRSDLPGRPILYGTTDEFLSVFNLKDLSTMPPLRELEQMVPASQSGEEEDPRVIEMRRLVQQMKSDKTRIAYDPREDEKLLAEIRERVQGISVTTPTLEAEKEAERQAKEMAKAAAKAAAENTILGEERSLTPDEIAAEMVSATVVDAQEQAELLKE